ncbi:hypothetical protein [Sphingobacterium cellulitidis]|uniref:Uncharacterized protein n=1 Tax=Sphingobacterium cellulitidis TaxID=1768011 RepID=A0A8H9G171_9SPHI|nr:hypothetical protein [Sphingobacterium soli]MBA8986285.1 hypothetical protein [Sphingobacterium soli]OYD42781.1 hypothetical protein CHT99_08175 [Sphingobacterium cellulitidis]GGE18995.1 hypothetical protein GCM10011516_15890 [Sphingobacterium soli]
MRLGIIFVLISLTISSQLIGQQKSTKIYGKNPDEIFLGAIISKKSINTEKHEFVKMKTNQKLQAISSTFKYEYPAIIPSKSNMNKIIIDEFNSAGLPSTTPGGAVFSLWSIQSYNELNIRFGQKMDFSKWFGLDPKAKMAKSNILIEYEIPLFDLYLDLFTDEINNYVQEIKALKNDDLIYISNISWGRKALILVQSDFDENKVKPALYNYLDNKTLTEEQSIILETASISYNIFDDTTLELTDPNPLKTIISYITAPITKDNYGGILYFFGSELDGAWFENSF